MGDLMEGLTEARSGVRVDFSAGAVNNAGARTLRPSSNRLLRSIAIGAAPARASSSGSERSARRQAPSIRILGEGKRLFADPRLQGKARGRRRIRMGPQLCSKRAIGIHYIPASNLLLHLGQRSHQILTHTTFPRPPARAQRRCPLAESLTTILYAAGNVGLRGA